MGIDLKIKELNDLGLRVPNPIDSTIYKYESMETAIKIIDNSTLLYSSPNDFNDPFDMTNSLIDKSFNEESLRSWLDTCTTIYTAKEKEDLYNTILINPSSFINDIEQTLSKYKNRAGITCFSKSHMKTLMWSHYANKHAGVCLGFKFNPTYIRNFSLLEVNYVDKIIPQKFFTNDPNVILYWFFTKSKVWSYEEEVRIAYFDKKGLIPFEKSCLVELHFGLRTTSEQREAFKEKLEHLGYRIQKFSFMSLNSDTFDLCENRFE